MIGGAIRRLIERVLDLPTQEELDAIIAEVTGEQ